MSLIYKTESYDIIGACMEVHKELGCGFLEQVYQEAVEREFFTKMIPFEREVPLQIIYKGRKLEKEYFADFLCHNKIVLELKAVHEFSSEHKAQVINYLKATGYKLGILVNFGQTKLEYKRLVRNITN